MAKAYYFRGKVFAKDGIGMLAWRIAGCALVKALKLIKKIKKEIDQMPQLVSNLSVNSIDSMANRSTFGV